MDKLIEDNGMTWEEMLIFLADDHLDEFTAHLIKVGAMDPMDEDTRLDLQVHLMAKLRQAIGK